MMRLIPVCLLLVAVMVGGPAQQARHGPHGTDTAATASASGMHGALCDHHGGDPGCSVAPALPVNDTAGAAWSRGPAFALPPPPGRYRSPGPDSRFRPPAPHRAERA